jgi:FKBP-type peptidyl-prolyl cis-trans isomerase FkpA
MNASRLATLPLAALLAACSAAPHPATVHPSPAASAPATVAAPLPSSDRRGAATPEVTTELDKTLYALGVILGRNLDAFSLTPHELALVQRGLAEKVAGDRLLVTLDEYGPRVNELRKERMSVMLDAELKKSAAFVAREAAEPGAQRLPSGVIYRPLSPGSGRSPAATDRVKVQYIGTLADGREFDSSVAHHSAAEFPLPGVIPCWTEGLQKMRVGERAILVCPSSVAYGDAGRPPTIRGGAALRFEIELIDVVDGK